MDDPRCLLDSITPDGATVLLVGTQHECEAALVDGAVVAQVLPGIEPKAGDVVTYSEGYGCYTVTAVVSVGEP